MLSHYPLPRYGLCATGRAALVRSRVAGNGVVAEDAPSTHPPALSFGVGPDGSGVPFYFHNDGFSEVLHGAKLWLLSLYEGRQAAALP